MGFGSPGEYLILDTDYENYAVFFSCEEENNGPDAAVLTREDHPDSLFVSCLMPGSSHIRRVLKLEIVVELCLLFFQL